VSATARLRHVQVGARAQQRLHQRLLSLVQVVDAVHDDGLEGTRGDSARSQDLKPRRVLEAMALQLPAVGRVEGLEVGGLGRRGDRGRPARARLHARLPEICEGGGQRLREVWPLADRREIGEAVCPALGDEAPHQPLAGEAGEHRRRPRPAGSQSGGQSVQCDDADVRHGADAPHEQIFETRSNAHDPTTTVTGVSLRSRRSSTTRATSASSSSQNRPVTR
jgi:hypothetical protein